MTKRTTRQRAPDDPDGPPDIQRDPVEAADGTILRPARVEETEWTDPDDKQALERGPDGRRRARKVKGFRVVDPILFLHRRNPETVTARHLRSVSKLRDDSEAMEAVRLPGSMGGISAADDPHEMARKRAKAAGRFRDAFNALGPSMWWNVAPIVFHHWTVGRLSEARGISAHSMQGYLVAALDRLADVYEPEQDRRATIATAVPEPPTEDAELPPDRLGRWREPAAAGH